MNPSLKLLAIAAFLGYSQTASAEIMEIKSDSTTMDACTQAIMIADTKAAKQRNWSTGDYVAVKRVSDCKCTTKDNINYCTTSFEFTPVKAQGNSKPSTKNQ